jgi:asparagine N-glycosylation enzyme membrane subunit Stt3
MVPAPISLPAGSHAIEGREPIQDGACVKPLVAAQVLAVALLALAVRCLEVGQVFGVGDEVFLGIGDSAYHARRALFSFVNFPAVLYRDPYLAYPDGAVVPMPPLYDWMVGALARLFGDSTAVFEHVAAWVGPILAALTVIPLYATGRAVGGPAIGVGAAVLFALLPAHSESTRLGDVDSHAAVAFLGALYLAALVALVRRTHPRGRLLGICAALVLVQALLALSWSGSLLYLALGQATMLLAGLLAARTDVLGAQAASALGTALVAAPWIAVAPTPIAGPFTTTTLSWIHVVLLAWAAFVGGGLVLWRSRWRSSAPWCRLGFAALLTAASGVCVLLLVPALLESLAPAAAFLSKTDRWAERNPEQHPLFSWSDGLARSAARAQLEYGYLAYLIPLTLPAALARARDPAVRGAALCLSFWIAALGSLALAQIRFGSDFAVPASIGFALLLAQVARRALRGSPAWAARLLASAAGAALLWPAIAGVHLPAVPGAIAFLRDPAGWTGPRPSGAFSIPGALALERFAHTIRSATPETAGYFDPGAQPEYGILCWPPHGHVMSYAARRATPASGSGPYLDADKLAATVRFYQGVSSEERALEIAEQLKIRYVVTFDREGDHPRIFSDRLHETDGSRRGSMKHVERMRLIVEGPIGGMPLPIFFPSRIAPANVIPYKLYEIVAGAVLEARGPPGRVLAADALVRTSSGRRFLYQAATRSDADGVARLRVPYASETSAPTRPEGPYRVLFGKAETRARVSDADVRDGAVIRVDAP